MMAQYSVPYSVALSLWTDPEDPENFSEKNLSDSRILGLARRVDLVVDEEINKMEGSRAARVTVRLKDGNVLEREILHFKGTPKNPLTEEELSSKVKRLACHALEQEKVGDLVEKVRRLEAIEDMGTLL
jgi:2-methylcitrate dehydratase PrpD